MSSNREPPAHYPVRALRDLGEAVTEFTSRATEKLRSRGHHACRILVFIHTSPFRRDEPQYSKAIAVLVRLQTIRYGTAGACGATRTEVIHRKGFNFARAGAHLLDLEPANVGRKEPLDEGPHGRDELMSAMDRINAKYEYGSLYLASAGTAEAGREWTR